VFVTNKIVTNMFVVDCVDHRRPITARQVRLNLGGSVYDPGDPVGRLLFNVLAMVAESQT
jgi:hypothetical protein